jgi:phosphatidylglycerol---prolipoprotein diacylglyceryl transferase
VRPVLGTLFGVDVPAYAVFVAAAFLVAVVVRRIEARRLGFDRDPRQRWVSLGALLGAMVGAKAGMLLFTPDAFDDLLAAMLRFDFSGKTVVGGLVGGFLGVEVAKKLVGITARTGDAFAVAIPLAQAVGRVGCFLHGCCWGAPSTLPWAVEMHGAARHPVQLYEAALDLALAALLWSLRARPAPAGNLFRRYLVGYAVIRFCLEVLRDDPSVAVGPFTAAQVVALVAGIGFAYGIARSESASATANAFAYSTASSDNADATANGTADASDRQRRRASIVK